MNHQFIIKAYSTKELAGLYGCKARTMRIWLRALHPELGPRQGHQYNLKQVRMIVERLGEPSGNM